MAVKEELPEGVIGRIIVKDVGYIDVKDKDTFKIAKMYLKFIAKKLGIEGERDENILQL